MVVTVDSINNFIHSQYFPSVSKRLTKAITIQIIPMMFSIIKKEGTKKKGMFVLTLAREVANIP